MFVSSLFLISCSQNKLPAIKDPEQLRKDCSTLFQQFPIIVDTNLIAKHGTFITNFFIRAILMNNLPPSIQSLRPIQVIRDNFGIRILIESNENPTLTESGNWTQRGYFVPCVSFSPFMLKSDVPYFEETGVPGIYEIIMPAVAD